MGLIHSPKIPSKGLVHAYDVGNPRCAPEGTISVLDLVGDKNAQIDNGAFVSPEFGGCIKCDDTDDAVEWDDGSSDEINLGTGPQTVSVWYYQHNPSEGYVIVFGSSLTTYGYHLAVAPSNTIIRVGIGQDKYFGSLGGSITGEKWQNVTYTRDGTYYRIYVDGVQKTATDTTLTADTTIGRMNGSTYHRQSDYGCVYMYNRVLSATEVKQLYDAMKGRYNRGD